MSKKIELNQQQQDAVEKINQFLATSRTDNLEFGLFGFAGTGKTTVLAQNVIPYWLRQKKRICATAPTNKAVRVIRQMLESFGIYDVECLTTYSLLALRPQPDKDGIERVVPAKDKEPRLDEFDIVIVDESSMVGIELYTYLQSELYRNTHVKVIYMGDKGQLPPVKETYSQVFNVPFQVTLDHVMRQEGDNPLKDVIGSVRDQLGNGSRPKVERSNLVCDRGTRGIWWVPKQRALDEAIRRFNSPKYRDNPDLAKVICWTNRNVAWFNERIRNAVYAPDFGGDPRNIPAYIKGERLIVNTPIQSGDMIVYPTSEELEISGDPIEGDVEGYKCWFLEVESLDSGKETTIQVLHADGKDAFNEAWEAEKAIAKQTWEWKEFYRMKNLFADVAPSFAITGHKSQGSTYTTTIVDVGDGMNNKNIVPGTEAYEATHWLYTVLSRASDQVIAIG